MKPFISLCMIVKNEEKVLDRCLSSVVNLIDEIIVVDTGSTDNTKEIASKYTHNIYDFEWINDFSAARNYAASKATGEWILVLDADEYIDEENFNIFVQEIKDDNDTFDAYTAKILNFTGNFGESLVQNFHDRVYKNNGEISYYRHIHEQFKSNKDEQLKIKNSSLLIFHSGYLNKIVNEKSKGQRNKELLKKEMNSGSKNAFDYFNLGNEYSSIGEYEKALDSYLQAYKLKTDFRLSWVSTTLVQIVISLINLKRYNDALNVITDAENMYTTSPEFPYLKGEIYFLRGQLEDAKQMFHQIINNGQKYNHIILRPDLKDQKPHTRLGEIYLYEEDYRNSIFHYTNVLNINKYNEESIKRIIYILNKFHTTEEIASFLTSNELVNEKNIPSYVKASFDVGNPSLAINLLKDYADEYKLLNKVALLKRLCIDNVGNIEQFYDIFKPEIIKHLMESNWVNIVDILLLRDYVSTSNDLLTVFNSLKQDEKINKLMNLVEGNESVANIDEDLIIYALQMFFAYKKYELCNVILDEIEKTDKSTILKVARILFSKGFKGEALQLYDLCDWDAFNEQDFINIINSLLETNNKAGAVEVAKYAMITFEEDFRFYKYVLENVEDTLVFKQTLNKAIEIFAQSEYLKTIMSMVTGEHEYSDEDKKKIIINEKNNILDAFLKSIDEYLINNGSLTKDKYTICYPYISFLNEENNFAVVKFLLVHGTKKQAEIEIKKIDEEWTLGNLRTDESNLTKKKSISKKNYTNRKPKMLLGYRDFSGCNTLALYKSVPSYILDEFEVDFVKGATNEFAQKTLDSDIIVTTNMEYYIEPNDETNEKIVIDTWHGFPLKNMFYTDPHYFNKNSIAPFWKQIDYSLSYSDLYSKIVNKSIKVDPENFVITGSPRNDFLFNENISRALLLKLLGKEDNGQKFIFFMPTFRKADVQNTYNSSNLFGFKDFNIDSLESFLEENNYELIVKLHPIYKKQFNDVIINSSRISMYPEYEANKEFVDLYEVLSATDILITDYSSVYFDYLLLDKPIIFATPDLKEYQEERGFCLEPFEEWTPGPKVVTQEQLQSAIRNCNKEKDQYYQARRKVRNNVHQYIDGNSSVRVWNFISSLYH